MNGAPLCEPGHECSDRDDQAMTDLMAYMDHLTDRYNKTFCESSQGDCVEPKRGFPKLLGAPVGEASAGSRIYQQKCAFCHGVEGEGRYGPSGQDYFRPALWGGDSFNAAAVLGRPDELARFIKANMPYTSGGMLTEQEAQDIACFIDAQNRPGKPAVSPDQKAKSGSVCR